ncbi:MAG: sulfatase-like hydrolase/transferase [Planctomycetota bacterium]|jgi:arylsulfatase A-like enzyme
MKRQTRRKFLKTIGLTAASVGAHSFLSGCAQPGLSRKQTRRPNILFLFTDDQRFDTIGALGNKQIITPNMDNLVRTGTTFTRAYIMGSTSGAVCMPSRAMLMSGQNLFDLTNSGRTVPPEHTMLPEVLREAGYVTFGTGKWHNGREPFARSFTAGGSIFFGGMSDHYKVPICDFDPTGKYSKESRYHEEGKHSSELFSDAAVEFLRKYKKEDKRFFVYVSYTAPHDPRTAPKEYHDMYEPAKIALPANFTPEHPFDNGEMRIRDEKLAGWPRTHEEMRRHIADYYAMITHVDAQIGRVLEALEATGQAENTIIVFSADNGLAVGRHGLMGKQNLYEHSVHVPLIICGPGIPRGERCDGLCYVHDIYPTLCELVGVPVPATVKSKSLVPALRRNKGARGSLFFAYKDIQRGLRDERHKLIEYSVKGRRHTQLYDLRSDPWELKNLAADSRYSQQLQRLRKRLRAWRDELGDSSEFWEGY